MRQSLEKHEDSRRTNDAAAAPGQGCGRRVVSTDRVIRQEMGVPSSLSAG